MTFNHPTHPLKVSPEQEIWCGGTEPPSIVEVDIAARDLTVRIYGAEADVHDKDSLDQQEVTVTEKSHLEIGHEMDAAAISRTALRGVRRSLGLDPEYRSLSLAPNKQITQE